MQVFLPVFYLHFWSYLHSSSQLAVYVAVPLMIVTCQRAVLAIQKMYATQSVFVVYTLVLFIFQCPENLYKQDGTSCDSNQVCTFVQC